jgi:tetratricopeptide (TPR) repeat protein
MDPSSEQSLESLNAIFERASSLNNASVRLLGEGRADEAGQASGEAVELYRELSAATDADFRWHLATALLTHSTNVAVADGSAAMASESTVDEVVGRPIAHSYDALLAAKEGTELLARLLEESPERYRLDMVMALRSYALRLVQTGFRDEAVAAAERGSRLSMLVEPSPAAIVERSKVHLIWAGLLTATSQPRAALEAAEIAAAGFKALADHDPQFSGWYAKAQRRAAVALKADGNDAAAAHRALEVISWWLENSPQRPPAHDQDLDDVVALYVRVVSALDGRTPRDVAADLLARPAGA